MHLEVCGLQGSASGKKQHLSCYWKESRIWPEAGRRWRQCCRRLAQQTEPAGWRGQGAWRKRAEGEGLGELGSGERELRCGALTSLGMGMGFYSQKWGLPSEYPGPWPTALRGGDLSCVHLASLFLFFHLGREPREI